MNRDEFIDYWLANTGLPPSCRLPEGVMMPRDGTVWSEHWQALPCACAEESCRGWAMVPDNLVDHHMRVYAFPHPTWEEHLAWCRQRALEHLDGGKLGNAAASMISDLEKHPEAEDRIGAGDYLARIAPCMDLVSGGDAAGLRRWIESFK